VDIRQASFAFRILRSTKAVAQFFISHYSFHIQLQQLSYTARDQPIFRLLGFTPEMYRVHDSVIIQETNINYGFNLPW